MIRLSINRRLNLDNLESPSLEFLLTALPPAGLVAEQEILFEGSEH